MILTPEFLKQAPSAVRAGYEAQARPFTVPAGKQILLPGQECTVLHFVVSGRVRVYLLGQDGREITLYRVEDGQACVLTASCILGGAGFPASAVVETEASGAAVAAEVFRDWVCRHAFWRNYVFRLIGERMAAVLARFEESAFDRLDARLAKLLLRQVRAGETSIRATHQDMANELGSAREAVSRALERWQQLGLVKLHRGEIELIGRKGVERLAGQ